jgi:RNA polymerase sigma factor (sigma-70 family)
VIAVSDSVKVKRMISVTVGQFEYCLSEDVALDLCHDLCHALGVRVHTAEDDEPAPLRLSYGQPPPIPVLATPPALPVVSMEDKAVEVFQRVSKTRPDWYAVASASGQSKLPAAEVRRILAERGIEVKTRRVADPAARGPVPVAITPEMIVAKYRQAIEEGTEPAAAIKLCQQELRRKKQPTLLAEEIRQALRGAGIDPPKPQNRGGYRAHKKDARTRAQVPIAERVVAKYQARVQSGDTPQQAVAACQGLSLGAESPTGYRGIRTHEVRSILRQAGFAIDEPSNAPMIPPVPGGTSNAGVAERLRVGDRPVIANVRPAALPPTAYKPSSQAAPREDEYALDSLWAKVKKAVVYNIDKHGHTFTVQDREEMVAEAKMRLWRNIDKIRENGGAVAYATRIAVNICYSRNKHRSRRIQTVPDEFETPGGKLLSRVETVPDSADDAFEALTTEGRLLRDAAQGLPDDLRAIFLARLEGRTLDEIAEGHGLCSQSIRRKLDAATETLRYKLNPQVQS